MIGPRPFDAPPPLLTAASLVVVEALLVVLFAVAELVSVSSQRLTMGLTTSLFFAAYGVGLGACAWALSRRHAWARGPVLLAQLIWLGLAWNFRGGETVLVAIGLAVVALVVIAGLLHPASMEALDPDREA